MNMDKEIDISYIIINVVVVSNSVIVVKKITLVVNILAMVSYKIISLCYTNI